MSEFYGSGGDEEVKQECNANTIKIKKVKLLKTKLNK